VKNEPKSGVYSCEFVANLKKQSQFLKGENVAMSSLSMVYVDFDGLRRRENKAKQSQFQTRRRFWYGKIEIAAVAALLRNDT